MKLKTVDHGDTAERLLGCAINMLSLRRVAVVKPKALCRRVTSADFRSITLIAEAA